MLADTFKLSAQGVRVLQLDRRAWDDNGSQYNTDELVMQITRDLPQLAGRADTIIVTITAA
jgi:hypothetical protein